MQEDDLKEARTNSFFKSDMRYTLYSEEALRGYFLQEVARQVETFGIAKEMISICREFELSDDEIESRLQQKFEIPEHEAKRYVELYDEMYDKRRADERCMRQAMASAIVLKENGLSVEEIAEAVDFSVEKVKEWLEAEE